MLKGKTFSKIVHLLMNKKCKIVQIKHCKNRKFGKYNLKRIENKAFLGYGNHGGVNYV